MKHVRRVGEAVQFTRNTNSIVAIQPADTAAVIARLAWFSRLVSKLVKGVFFRRFPIFSRCTITALLETGTSG